MYDHQALEQLIRGQALQFGQFTLASGKEASFYLDCRMVTLDSRGAFLIGEGFLELLGKELPDLVGGMVIGADPITGAMLALAGQRQLFGPGGRLLRGIMVRKESKGHGTGKYVEGPYAPDEEVVIVEDVVTTGGSSLKAIERCRSVGLQVRRVLAIIDRLEGGREAFADHGVELTTLFTIHDLGIQP